MGYFSRTLLNYEVSSHFSVSKRAIRPPHSAGGEDKAITCYPLHVLLNNKKS